MNYSALIQNRKSVREFTEKEVTLSQLETIRCTLPPRAGSPYNCAVIALNGRLAITFSRFCRQRISAKGNSSSPKASSRY